MKAEEMLKSHKVRPTANRLIVISALMEHEHPMSIKEFEENRTEKDGKIEYNNSSLDRNSKHKSSNGIYISKTIKIFL